MDDLELPFADAGAASERTGAPRDAFLIALGERVRLLRSRSGLTRRALSIASDVSERHLANLEQGVGNASILVLRAVSKALGCELAELLGDETAASPEWLLIRDLLRGRGEDELRRGRLALAELYEEAGTRAARGGRIALIGLRGAGKSTLGALLAQDLGVDFVELNREIERVAGCGVQEIHGLLGANAYRRYERRALEETIQLYPDAVIAAPGGLVSDPANFNLLLTHCYTVWLKASPQEHMQRVLAQGDLRPMAASQEAMDDLKRILAGRSAFYGQADLVFDTGGKTQEAAFAELSDAVRVALGQVSKQSAMHMN
ncbi:helix-turn-helix transcriptional regulator [Piscinibacter sp.]|uniref:helix-turn-helix transcriptional regulator n=1 Tax=Piscinibacter sp. TaxID=1903157 RepID=UPI002C292A38|nr:helix-turn-helix transcriptional regulator [Albitalea sp.]HUG21298.1 helix-turn-helix transcriptional regulator [Albitalea sp.]